jgi:acyl-CoA:acyl-CoA alkyltransferase
MRLSSVRLAVPSRKVTNEDILELIRTNSQDSFSGDLERTLAQIQKLLEYSGAACRFWLDDGQSPMELISAAATQALIAARLDASEIDLVISAGVDRGCLEPANAYFIADSLGMKRVACFDVLDACNGWSRAVQLVDALFRVGTHRRVLVINAEFPMFTGGPIYPALFRLRSRDELTWSFAGYTMGEGATVSVLTREPNDEWEFHFSSRPDLADLCSLPIDGYRRYCGPSPRVGRNGVNRFASYSTEMFSAANAEVSTLFRGLSVPLDAIRTIIPHAATRRLWDEGAEALGVRDRLYHIYPRLGNLVSASIPAGIAMAVDEGRIQRGDRVVSCVESAGMSYSVCSFTY